MKKYLNRRNFLKSTGIGITTLSITNNIHASAKHLEDVTKDSTFFSNPDNQKPVDLKLNVKPIYSGRIHLAAYGGPCRWDAMEQMTPEVETRNFSQRSKRFFETARDRISEDSYLMQPESVVLHRSWKEYEKGDIIKTENWEKIEADVSGVDLFLTSYRVHGLEKYNKPIAWVGNGSWNLDWSAFLRNVGVEGYAPYDWDELNELISLLRVRKAIQKTKVLVVSDRPESPPICLLASIKEKDLKEKFGVDYQNVSYKEFFNEMDRITLSKTEQEKAKDMTDRLIENSKNAFIRKENILNDINFYLTAKSVMNKYNCNAFIIRCFELCGSHIAADRKITPCLANILLRDEGYPSACEGDLNALFTTMIAMYVSRKPVYMGNTIYDAEEKRLRITHDAATLKMKGLGLPDLPYEIQPFTHETAGAFGTTIRYDFSLDKGQAVTVLRANPVRRKMMLAKGEIIEGTGFRETGCSLGVNIGIPDVKEFYHKGADIGSHLVVVYGDYTKEIRKLGEIMNYEVL
ncbi:hypothetical protein ACFLU5_16005 [Bacteroidota bacterium]